ncbi:hypothetical protein Afil01_29750 [Actinorhabdospora filicis]|uniref:S1 motif domain-containing protein n=1 Tax=Actinorhabdospora filicis TaxID=1785913 RepID=A0A9W6SKZ6_9ACTN|nr:S1 RNA-binding domain-containing protein [Actinorhabdospora filicis]GLZ78168.1 hypothetical protein Afil01_29750 [Actinorhabdospora filicis]
MSVLPYVYRVTKYDPADRDEHGVYIGSAEPVGDQGPVESAYLQAVAAFAEAIGVDHLVVREPQIAAGLGFGVEPAVEGHGLAGLFPPDLTGFHDGAEVSLALGLELVRAMLRDSGTWCRLEVEGVFAVHVGWDQYVYIGGDRPCEDALARVAELGLFAERVEASPYAADHDEPGEQRPADDDFWARLHWLVIGFRAAILEETYVDHATRWHRLDGGSLDEVRARLRPRARLAVWPDLSADVGAVLAGLSEEGMIELVWEDEDGVITSAIADETRLPELTARVTGARAAAALSVYSDERRPLLTAVLPDADGVLRARWRTEPTASDRDWAVLKTLRPGQIVTGTVTEIAPFLVTFVDIGGFTAMINIPELSWRIVRNPSEVVGVGQEITAVILGVDMARESAWLSLKALLPDPMADLVRRVGEIVTGPVTKLLPFGALVRIEDAENGFEGLVPNGELAEEHVERPEDVVQVGDMLTVRIIKVDLTLRRITLSRKQTHAAAHPDGHPPS